jgi:hypothetical protein
VAKDGRAFDRDGGGIRRGVDRPHDLERILTSAGADLKRIVVFITHSENQRHLTTDIADAG